MEKKKIFVIMPFNDEFFEVFEMLKMQFGEEYEFSNAGEEANQQNILKDIIQPIYEADIVIADLTGLNPNVMYELGLAHSFNKKTITITQDELALLPFDLKQYRAKDYSTHFKKFAELIEYLKTNLKGAVDNSVVFSNPVKDFLNIHGEKTLTWQVSNETVGIEDETEKGFLDYLADIETDATALTSSITEMTTDMQEMCDGIKGNTEAINRVQQTGGNGTASFVRKEAKKAAKHIDTFSTKLRNHNRTMVEAWDKIESNSLGLMENPFAVQDENKDGLINYLSSLYSMRIAAITSAGSIRDLKGTLENTLGIERSMNQAVRFLMEDLTTYVDFTDKLSSSIGKILSKSKFIVGDIDYDQMEIEKVSKPEIQD